MGRLETFKRMKGRQMMEDTNLSRWAAFIQNDLFRGKHYFGVLPHKYGVIAYCQHGGDDYLIDKPQLEAEVRCAREWFKRSNCTKMRSRISENNIWVMLVTPPPGRTASERKGVVYQSLCSAYEE